MTRDPVQYFADAVVAFACWVDRVLDRWDTRLASRTADNPDPRMDGE